VQQAAAQIPWFHNCTLLEDNPTIGIVLCRGKKKTIVEYALRDINKPIGVSNYTLKDTLPKQLQESLPSVEQLQIELEAKASEIEAISETNSQD
jgi:hypothetical protein